MVAEPIGSFSMHTVRRARVENIPVLMRIRAAVRENRLSDPAKVPAEAYRAFIDGPGIWLCADGDSILGFSAADPADGTIWALFVDPAAEGLGIGADLLSRALNDLRRAGWDEARLSTGPGTRAERFYRRHGWNVAGQTEAGEKILFRAL